MAGRMQQLRAWIVASSMLVAAPAVSAEDGAIPQMDPTWFPNQLIWLAISFALLYTIVSKLIVPRVDGVLATRKSTITEAIAKAEAFKATATQTHGEFEARAHEVHEQVAAMVAKAQATAAQTQTAALAKLNAELAAKEAAAARSLEQSLKTAQAEMETATAEVAKAIAEKLLGVAVDASAIKANAA